jgi:hypothetical protein
MKRLIPVLATLTFMTALAYAAEPINNTPQNQEIVSAFNVADFMEKGTSDTEIVQLLSKQRDMDLSAASLKGKSDEQVMYYLLSVAEPKGKVIDLGKNVTHKAAGDAALEGKLYEKAAKEYSLAINFSNDKHDIYKLRGDSYLEYLKSKLPLTSPEKQDEATRPLFERKRKLFCNSIVADYRTAGRLIDKSIHDGITKMQELEVSMLELRKDTDETLKFKKRSYSNINIMRDMRRLLYQQSSAKSAIKHLGLAMDEYKTVCTEEEAERRNLIRQARDKARANIWVLYSEKDDTRHYYDKTSLKKGKTGTIVVRRMENSDDETSYNLAKVTLDCKKKTIGMQEFTSFGEDGTLTAKTQYKQVLFKKILPGTTEELLRGKVCK